ncbi:unnamed protein product [Blepharisma stoltei]|uniref:26S proteasome non-ATPase regulatory subunit 2 homolog n=1 Tax=Blepharisma stoltei TaxID=1481888 RepID=A0AAU9K5K6_9CILI|nr:unnamed protein product [Blepharisma stoltei]
MADSKEKITPELSEEDQALKDKLDLLVQNLQDLSSAEASLKSLETEVQTATTSMTSIPKPLKFLKPHYSTIKTLYSTLSASPFKTELANFLSILAVTMGTPEERESLQFLLQGNQDAATKWGQEYVRNLCGEIRDEYLLRLRGEQDRADLLSIVDIIAPFLIKHSSEFEAIDLLSEVDCLENLTQYVELDNYKRMCQYIEGMALYAADPDEMYKTLHVCFKCYLKAGKFPEALRIALKINRPEIINEAMESCTDPVAKKQMCYQLARQRVNFQIEDEDLAKIISNEFMNEAFIKLATDLEVLEPKVPEDIYKSHLEERGRGVQGGQLDSHKQNLASTIVNAFVNAGYCNDALVFDEEKKWVFRHKEWGLMTAAASLGLLLLWNVDEGMTRIDKYQYSREDFIRSGALMAFGTVNAGIKNECDPAFALLTEGLDAANDKLRVGIIAGLSLAYAGSGREDVLEVLSPIVIDTSVSLESSALAALGLGLVFVGTCNEDVAQVVLQTLMERSETELSSPYARFFALGIGLVFLGQQDRVQTTMSIIEDLVAAPIKKYALLTVESCAYAGSGNVLKVQEMLQACAEHLEEKEWQHQMVAVIGFSLIAMGENVGIDMALRAFDHLLQYGDLNIKRATPLAIALLCISNPKVNVIDILSKLSHDVDAQVAQAAIFAIGMVGAGTNNSRLAGTLRQLAGFYSNEDNQLFMVRIAQGLLHMGKGLMTLDPYHSERYLLSPVALGGILTVLHTMLNIDQLVHGHGQYLLFYLACAIYPRMLVTLDENLQPISVQVRVGQAVDTVGQAGNPRTITGFQTHTTPVLLAYGERAELATEEYIPYSEVLENFIILKKNPNFVPE